MSVNYSKRFCPNCNQNSRASMTFEQKLILYILAITVIGFIIYFFLSRGNRCYICGLRYKSADIDHDRDKNKIAESQNK